MRDPTLWAVLALAVAPAAAAADVTLTWQGRLLDADGAPIDGPRDLEIALWSHATSADLAHRVHADPFPQHPVESGFVSVRLGAAGGLDASELAAGPLWVEVRVGGVALGPRAPLVEVPRAAHAALAADADTVDGLHAAAFAPAVHTHGQASCTWHCVDTPGTLLCPSDKYVAGLSFPQLGSTTAAPPTQTCSGSTNSDDVAVYCCTVR